MCASAASVLALTALAQEPSTPKTDRLADSRDRILNAQQLNRLNGTAKASDVIGMEVQNNQNENIAKVADIAVDVESGRVVQVILSTGGFLGLGDTLTAVPPGAFHLNASNKVYNLDADKEKLKGAPKFDDSMWEVDTQSNRVAEVYSYYGEKPYFTTDHDGDWTANKDVRMNKNDIRALDKAANTEPALKTDEALGQERDLKGNRANYSRGNLGYVQKASKLIGTPVKNIQDEKLGKVENLILDLSAGRIVAVIISSGGFIGIGDELSAVPPTALRYNSEHTNLELDASKEMLASSPHFKANEWPDMSQPGYAGGVYRAYKVEPYFTTDTTPNADNTKRNIRDRDSKTLTPLDQGNSKSDVTMTAEIRKEIITHKEISTNAKNVKIITQNGQVTLRGPVQTSEEKQVIGEIANRIAQVGNVDNQLEVKVNPTTTKNE
jgi:sporulation protein YlmC with PRC-barrel domain